MSVGPALVNRHDARVDGPASLIDVAPTVLDAAGIASQPEFQGRSLRPSQIARRREPEPIYAESMYARDHLGCSPLRSIRFGRYKYIDAPRPELYDLGADPGEEQNVYDRDRSRALALRARLASLSSRRPERATSTASDDAVARLRSLGYLGTAGAVPSSGADPKDRLAAYETYGRAIRFANSGRLPEAIVEFEKVLKQDENSVLARYYIAVCDYRLRRYDDAIKLLDSTLALARDYAPAQELLGTIWLLKKDYARAGRQFARLTAVAPDNFAAHYNLGILAMRDGRIDEARRELQIAARVDAGSSRAHSSLGSVYRATGDLVRAREQFLQALALDPTDEPARAALRQITAGK